jgi:2-polyprenyl-6-methoxyphenol hydroxylase-like FAD-dependent oxidoreductase
MKPYSDVVIVGGGIAGSALALVLARRGTDVTVLEHQRDYADRVRGEYMHPWGVAEAQRLGILEIFLSAGGVFATRAIGYDESIPSNVAEARARDIGSILPGVSGGLGVGHPAACRALSRAAEAAGARYWRGASKVSATLGAHPAVVFEKDGSMQQAQCRLIVGADGRNSTVRHQAGIALGSAEATHLFSGMLVGDVPEWPQDTYSTASAGDTQCQIFPQGSKRVRLYTTTAPDQRRRYGSGPDGRARFLNDFRRMACMPLAESLAGGTPLGPCATFPGEDTWVDVPFVEGVVLVGDAAGYNDPLIGQGLSLALRDTRVLSEILLAAERWSPECLLPYAEERRRRLRRVRFTAALMAELYATFGPEGAARRGRFLSRLSDPDFRGRALLASLAIGPDRSPDWAYTEDFRTEVLES